MAQDEQVPFVLNTKRDSGHSTGLPKEEPHQPYIQDDITSSKMSGSTAHSSTSSSLSDPDELYRYSFSDDEDSDEDASMMLEAQKEAKRNLRRLKIAIALCGSFFIIELIGATLSGSLALLSDSFHLLTDITSFIISLTAVYLSRRAATATHTFGYHRAEVLGALFSIFLIWGLTLTLVVEAYSRLRNPIAIDGKTMSVVAGVGVCVNISLMFVLGGHDGEDSGKSGDDQEQGIKNSRTYTPSQEHTPLGSDNDHDNESSALTEKAIPLQESDSNNTQHQRKSNLNMTAATLHVLGDLLSSIGVLTSSVLITFYPNLTYLDPICTFVFSIMVIATTVGVFKQSVSILMERVPRDMNSEDIKVAMCDIPGVLEVKSLHIWSLTTGQAAMAGTVYLQPEVRELNRASMIVAAVRKMVKKQHGIRECTIQVALHSTHSRSYHQHHAEFARDLDISSSHFYAKGGKGYSRYQMDPPATHNQEVIFSIGDDGFD
ncbi:hypothetical protein BGZ98_007023 [Dissophora globulifera]|nr:hypothetical protein BGZ98_007023 [Dissophora globulifera]